MEKISQMIKHSSPYIADQDIAAVVQQLKTNNIANGETVKKFELLLQNFLQTSFLRTCSNGTNGIYLALKALSLAPQSEIILPTYVCHNVYDAVLHADLIPVLCDIGEHWLMTTDTVKQKITRKTSAIIIVHTMGITIDTAAFKKFGVPLVEDFCQNFGGIKNGNQAELIGDIGVYSFHATKCLTTGEGGAVATNRKDIAENFIGLLKNKSIHNPITDIQAALGIVQLEKYPIALLKRSGIAENYFHKLNRDLVSRFLEIRKDVIFFRFLLVYKGGDFENIKKKLEYKGISVRKGVDELLHQRYFTGTKDDFPNAEKIFRETLSIPILPDLTLEEQEEIVNAINSIL
jgi:perosamine synthetase